MTKDELPSIARFRSNRADIDDLWLIHETIRGGQPGLLVVGQEVLNRAAIVFITSCWEAFVEDLAVEACELLCRNAAEPSNIPIGVRLLASEALRSAKDPRKLWDLAGDGWRDVLELSAKHRIEALNTPKSANVDRLYEDTLGIEQVSQHWKWKNTSAARARKKLDHYISIRGAIAHRARHDTSVYLSWGTDYVSHVDRLAAATSEAVVGHVEKAVGFNPWQALG